MSGRPFGVTHSRAAGAKPVPEWSQQVSLSHLRWELHTGVVLQQAKAKAKAPGGPDDALSSLVKTQVERQRRLASVASAPTPVVARLAAPNPTGDSLDAWLGHAMRTHSNRQAAHLLIPPVFTPPGELTYSLTERYAGA